MRPQSPLVPPLRQEYLFQQRLWLDSTPLPAVVSPLQPYVIGPLGRHFRSQQRVLTGATSVDLAGTTIGVGLVTADLADLPAVPPLQPYRLGSLGRFFRAQQRVLWGATGKELAAHPIGVGVTTGAVSVLAAAVPLRQFRLNQLKYQQRTTPVVSVVDALAAGATGIGSATGALSVTHALAAVATGTARVSAALDVGHALSASAVGTGKASAQMTIIPRPPFELLRWNPLLKGYQLGRRPRR